MNEEIVSGVLLKLLSMRNLFVRADKISSVNKNRLTQKINVKKTLI